MEDHWIQLPQPRVAPGEGVQLAPYARVVLPLLTRFTGGRGANLLATFARNKRISRAWFLFAARLMPFGTLPRADTELVILRVAYLCRSRYEWYQHTIIGEKAGLSVESIERIKAGPDAAGWSPRPRDPARGR
jgi:alkylhydroperoxidase family enzyme